ncbi:MAG: hypothetical protein ACKOEO_11295 [Planctomycetaceae bacterium]
MYRVLDPEKTIGTLHTLSHRIEERFPQASLGCVCRELLAIARETHSRVQWAGSSLLLIRVAALFIVGIGIGCLLWGIRYIRIQGNPGLEELDAGANAIVLLGASIFFLFSLESRIKRHRILTALHELRSISHVIDMHQLTKDPSQIVIPLSRRTPSSPRRSLTPFQLVRYLDYCSELLSLVGKLAALYAQSTSDPVVLQAVNDIEQLTNGLARKIWQKIMMLDNDISDAREGESGLEDDQ